MAGILPRGNVTRQAQIASVEMACPQAVRYLGVPAPVSQNLLCRDWLPRTSRSTYKSRRGADAASSFPNAETQLVEAKLEMVRPAWLLQHRAVVRRFCWFSGRDRVQRSKIDGRLQGCADTGQVPSCRD